MLYQSWIVTFKISSIEIIERFERCIWKPMNTDQLWNKHETTVFIWIDPQMMNAEHISA